MCRLLNTSVRSIFRIRDLDCSVVQVSNQACSATSEMFLLVMALCRAPGAVLWPDDLFPDTTVHFVQFSGGFMGYLLAKRLLC